MAEQPIVLPSSSKYLFSRAITSSETPYNEKEGEEGVFSMSALAPTITQCLRSARLPCNKVQNLLDDPNVSFKHPFPFPENLLLAKAYKYS